MLVLGLILILVAAAVIVTAVAGGTSETTNFSAGGVHISMNSMTVFFVGAATLLVIMLGLAMVRSGAARANRRRKDTKKLKKLSAKVDKQEVEKQQLAQERDAAVADQSATTIPHQDPPEPRT
jgi:uncharacterized membrane protein